MNRDRSRRITTATPGTIRRLYADFGAGSKPPFALDHDGIEDSFVEKASVVRYRNAEKWTELIGYD